MIHRPGHLVSPDTASHVGRTPGIVPDSKQTAVFDFSEQGAAGIAVFVAGNRQAERIFHDAVPLRNDIECHEQPHAYSNPQTEQITGKHIVEIVHTENNAG